jgi:hypothetical protein
MHVHQIHFHVLFVLGEGFKLWSLEIFNFSHIGASFIVLESNIPSHSVPNTSDYILYPEEERTIFIDKFLQTKITFKVINKATDMMQWNRLKWLSLSSNFKRKVTGKLSFKRTKNSLASKMSLFPHFPDNLHNNVGKIASLSCRPHF